MEKKITRKISIIILTYNEEIHIERVLKNIKKISDQIFIVDSFSNDKTIAIAKKNGAKIYKNRFITQSKQLNWALKNLPIKTNWVMRLDADEYLEADLIKEIKQKIPRLPKYVTGVNLKRTIAGASEVSLQGGGINDYICINTPGENIEQRGTHSISHVDSPNTTSACTYVLKARRETSGEAMVFNYGGIGSQITLIEIAG